MSSISEQVASNNVWMVKHLVSMPGTVSRKELNHALLQAAKLGFAECAKALLEGGAEGDFVNTAGNTPLITAVKHNKPEVVKVLLEGGCAKNFRGELSVFPLHVAAQNGYSRCVDLLIQAGVAVDARNTEGNTPLILAAIGGHYIAIQSLISGGCDINAANNEGITALHYTCYKARGFQVLLDAGANPDARDKDNITPILMAASEGFDGVVKALVEANCDVNIPNNSVKRTALHLLSFKGHPNCINSLVYGGADINAPDIYNRTPLWYAIQNKKIEVVRLLLKAYSHVDTFQCPATSTSEDCPARLAFDLKLFDVIKFFILTGYDQCHVRECLQRGEFSDWLKTNVEFLHWSEFGSSAQTLKQLCRKWIRHHLGRQFYHHLQFLPLPEMMRNYLYIEELHDH
ncbi:ANR17-like protein [Mya arenaria]|uniref:ANR17-like protein n=1 Tax=Mya arenaria TaxID=6604 RepID=A0ABY7ECL0_MYAAR|nr:ankyrin repeat, PH and SEC7 domain containing protein secG-like [Mya arenaria]WAR07590.1 ANR17-like protein [Mya arenaria]